MASYDVTARLLLDAKGLRTPTRVAEAKRALEVMTPRPINWIGDLEYVTRIRVEADDEAQAARRAGELTRLRVQKDSGLTVVGFDTLKVEVDRANDADP
jgi:hypothetical protein